MPAHSNKSPLFLLAWTTNPPSARLALPPSYPHSCWNSQPILPQLCWHAPTILLILADPTLCLHSPQIIVILVGIANQFSLIYAGTPQQCSSFLLTQTYACTPTDYSHSCWNSQPILPQLCWHAPTMLFILADPALRLHTH